MIQNKHILAVIPARGGSKGIKLKNLRDVNGISLVAWVGKVVKQVSIIDRAVVSTDHDEIAEAAAGAGLSVPFRRPPELSGDRISDLQVLTHALETMEKIDYQIYEIVVMLQPTSPMRRPEHVRQTINKLVDEDLDAVWTVSETDSKAHPLKQLTISETDNGLDYYDPKGAEIIARQQLKPVYHRNGVAYAITRSCLLEQKTIKGEKSGALIIDDIIVNIDTELDIELANYFFNSNPLPPIA